MFQSRQLQDILFICIMISLCRAFRYHRNGPRTLTSKLFSSTASLGESKGFLAVHVRGKIVDSYGASFYRNTLANAKSSVLEPGISRFDVLRSIGDPNNFLLIEVYNSKTGPDEHKLTKHYNSWRDAVAPMMAEPRSAVKYTTIFPSPSNWLTDKAAGDIKIESYSDTLPWQADPHGGQANGGSMLAVIVDIEVKPGAEMAFIEATIQNCENSIKEVKSYNCGHS